MAPSSGSARFSNRFIALVFLLAVFPFIACSGAAAPARQANPEVAAPSAEMSAASNEVERIARITASARAALDAHDMRLYREFRNQLAKAVGPDALRAADTEYRLVLANLVAADKAGDAKSRAQFLGQLRVLCAPISLASAIERCETDLLAHGG